jgi:hypothetical protein
MFLARAASITPQAFYSGVVEQLGEENTELLGRAYGITPDMDQNLFVTKALRWVGDVVFEGRRYALP